jgi:hypothetical protein
MRRRSSDSAERWATIVMNGLRHLTTSLLLLSAIVAPVRAQVFTSEFVSAPISEGWGAIQQVCGPITWIEDGWYHQELDPDACPGPGGGRDVYRRSLAAFDGTSEFFTEFRVQTDGERSEIAFGGPALLVLGNNAGVIYHVTIARNLIQFYRAADLPILFVEIEPDRPHTFRVELYSNRYAFYIDGDLIDEGEPDGPFPANTPRITWQGQSWYLPCHNAWSYIRYGRLPQNGSTDYDSNGEITLFDWYFMHECLTKDGELYSGPWQAGPGSGPGCRFVDSDGDSDTDLLDFAEFQNLFGAD